MARPSKSVNTMSKNLTKEEKAKRLEGEEKLKGPNDEINPPEYLSQGQVIIFNYIVEQLKASGILGNIDVFVLALCAISIDRLQEIEREINQDIRQLYNKDLMAAKDKYTKDFFRSCNELSLSPQARAKLSNINLQQQQKDVDPLLKALRDDD